MSPILLVALGLMSACSARTADRPPPSSPAPIVWPTERWPNASPESAGLDPGKLAAPLRDLRANYSQLHSLLIVRNGSVVLDAYVYPYTDSMYHDLASVTKSFTATLVGIAATQGKLDLDAPMVSFFTDRRIANLDERKERITVRDLLSMSSGLDCSDWPYEVTQQQMRESEDWVQFVLDLEVTEEPGTSFSYCNPGMHLLSAIVQRATGMSALEFARAELFEPLGIHDVYWPSDPQGVTDGWGDLALTPRDVAKLGFLYLHDGVWNGERILSHGWVREATSAQARTGQAENYGYGWWVSQPGQGMRSFQAEGNWGQRILVVPARDLVVVTTGGGFSPDTVFEAIASATVGGLETLSPDPAGEDRLASTIAELAAPPPPEPVPPLPGTAHRVSGRTYGFGANPFGIRSVRVDFDGTPEATLRLELSTEASPRVDRVGLDGVFRPSRSGRPIVARGHWDGPRTFVIECDEGPGFHGYDIRLRFAGDAVRLGVLGVTIEGSA